MLTLKLGVCILGGGVIGRLSELRRKTRGAGVEAVRLSRVGRRGYSRFMSDNLDAVLDRLKVLQRDLILIAADTNTLPAGSLLKQIAELENVIAAVEAVADEEPDQQQQNG